MAFVLSPSAHRKQNAVPYTVFFSAVLLYLMSVVCKGRHGDVVIINSHLLLGIKFPTKRVLWIFHILKINRLVLFCTLFMERIVFCRYADITVKVC